MDDIRTRWHRAVEAVEAGQVSIKIAKGKNPYPLLKGSQEYQDLLGLFAIIDEVPKYYIEPSLMEIMERKDVVLSLQAMFEANITALPYPVVLVEVDGSAALPGVRVRNFVVLSERPESVQRMPYEEVNHPFRANLFRLAESGGVDTVQLSPATLWLAFIPDADDHDGGKGFGTHYMTSAAPYVPPSLNAAQAIQETNMRDFHVCREALDAMIVLLNTRGINKELVEPKRLNRARAKQRKRAVPSHTVLRVAHVYSHDGKRKEVPGWSQRFHIRPAYINHYWYGPRKDPDNPPVRRSRLVQSYMVNYDPANPDQVPLPRFTHVRA